MSKGSTQRGDGEAYRRNYPFGDRPAAAPVAVDPRDLEIARLKAELAEANERLAMLRVANSAQARTIAGKTRLWSEDEREQFRQARANRLANQARADADGKA